MAMLDLHRLTGDKPLTILQALVNQVSQRAALPPASSQPSIGTLLFVVDVWDGSRLSCEKTGQSSPRELSSLEDDARFFFESSQAAGEVHVVGNPTEVANMTVPAGYSVLFP
ncbi:hypothetical protein Moror_14442 [Moniliophthora roreri MCA 2997]|uniref:Uncharacterized protein n=1 Tax=Moniliophthora roreri (strain MCA 2997) TaxID=1381753 RepID=V2W5X8_MONRO|nr:hypothetical protein Moror_14442 [Moniliophthora roreri MCA 2997]